MPNKPFKRTEYFSQTELCKLFNLTAEAVKKAIKDNHIAVHTRPVEIGYNRGDNFNVEALYVLKTDWYNII